MGEKGPPVSCKSYNGSDVVYHLLNDRDLLAEMGLLVMMASQEMMDHLEEM